MAHVTFSEEPESLGPKDGTESSGVTAQHKATDYLLRDKKQRLTAPRECIRNGKNDLDKRVLEFLAVASAEERELLQTSRQQVLDIIDVAKNEQTKHRAAVPSSIIPSLADRVKRSWTATSEVAYEYVQMLDVMVSQAPEYIALAYGAIKILLVVQVNYEELKRKFNLIDHLTAYVPTSNIVIGVAQAYSLFYRFLAKAVKYYTQSRSSELPWRRFQDLVDSIEQTLSNVKDAANYHGLIENHINMVVSRKNLVISEANSSKLERTLELIQDLHSKVHAISIRFSKESDIRQTADALRQQTEEKLEEPVLSKVHPSAELEPDFDVTAAAGQAYLDTPDDLRNTLFAELRQADEVDARKKRAIEELPGMWAHRSENRNFMKSEKAAAWVESNKSQLLWIDGNHILSRTDFNASFAFPLILLGESRYESVLILRYFCQDNTGSTDQYLVMMQALLLGLFEQHPSIFKRRIESITRDQTSQTSNLWDLFLECLDEVRTQCVFILIGGIDHLVETRNPAQDTREDIGALYIYLMVVNFKRLWSLS
ncbi:hypothetical protein GQ53DRAFT_853744 [Thozetella sp. PMI_491]|nr:hypothetical protein GQ53DRAFT_853744 [Thozetella sp. PMI_491]